MGGPPHAAVWWGATSLGWREPHDIHEARSVVDVHDIGGELRLSLVEVASRVGLVRGTVALVASDPEWSSVFLAVELRLREALDGHDVVIEHIGSTAVRGLPAKPVIDVVAGVGEDETPSELIAPIEGLGFEFGGDHGDSGGLFFVLTHPQNSACRLVHLHLVARSDVQWRRYLRFRDALRRDPAIRAEYERIKAGAASIHPQDRRSYTAAKAAWIEQLLAKGTFTS